ncbi:MAG: alpha/beta hydrolase [Chloroflexaceae bacterium]|nr:alpha/beta hydrolase [Chloroflexaceae bacterium]
MNHASSPIVAAEPTGKYNAYLGAVQDALRGKPGRRERRRLEMEQRLLEPAQFMVLNGITHHYQDTGPRDGEPIVLVHGWDCSAFWWHHIVHPLAAQGYRVIIYDLKGHGFSDSDPEKQYTVESFSNDLLALADALELGPHHIAAFSLGAFVALHYAATYPEQVASLAFFNFSLLRYNRVASMILPRLLDAVFNGLLRPIARLQLWVIPFLYTRMVMAQNTPPVSDIKLGILSLICCDPEAVRISAKQLARRDILESVPQHMAQITQPTLLVAGDKDPIMQPKGAQELIAFADNGVYFEMPKCGHLILFELPRQVVQVLQIHLKTARQGI